LQLFRRERGRKNVSTPRGDTYDLEELFEKLNLRYFDGLMARPDLGWSLRPSRTTLGHYDPSHHIIVLSKILDRKEVARTAVEYVMFHEMLHLKYPVEHRGARRCVHTPEFKLAAKEFEGLKEAKDLLRKL
jgi:predicted SprT family Zn-dependent metalloprotease